MQFIKQLIWCVITGALLAAIGGSAYIANELHKAGYSFASFPPWAMLEKVFEVMPLHYWIGTGALAGLAFGLIARVLYLVKVRLSVMFSKPSAPIVDADADAIIRSERSQRADQYLASLGERSLDDVGIAPEGSPGAPDIENIITAREGRFTYRILAYRHLGEKERMTIVHEALRLGHVKEPEPGGIATVMSNVGKGG